MERGSAIRSGELSARTVALLDLAPDAIFARDAEIEAIRHGHADWAPTCGLSRALSVAYYCATGCPLIRRNLNVGYFD